MNHLNIITYLLAQCRGVLPYLSFEFRFAPPRTRYSQIEILPYLREERVDHAKYEYTSGHDLSQLDNNTTSAHITANLNVVYTHSYPVQDVHNHINQASMLLIMYTQPLYTTIIDDVHIGER